MRLTLAVLAVALLPWAGPAGGLGACPAPSPLGLWQDDGGSGRDAGHAPADAVPVQPAAWFYGALVPAVAVDVGFEDLHDWYVLDLAPGTHQVTLDLQNVPNLLLGMGNTVPLVYHVEFWREDGTVLADYASWQPAETVSVGGGRVLAHVFYNSVLVTPVCGPAQGAGLGPGLPPEAQGYGVRFECASACWA